MGCRLISRTHILRTFNKKDIEKLRASAHFDCHFTCVVHKDERLNSMKMIKSLVLRGGGKTLSELPEDQASFIKAFFKDFLNNDMDKKTYADHFKIALDMAIKSHALRMHEPMDGTGRVFIIQAADDETFNRKQRETLVKTYPGAGMHLFENGGYLLSITRQEELDNLIDEYLDF